MATIGLFSSLFNKGNTPDSNDREAGKRLSQVLLQKLIKGDTQGAISILEDAAQSYETRAKLIGFCETLADVGLKPARKALTIALQHSSIFREKEADRKSVV